MRVHRRALLVGSVLLVLSAVVALPLATAQTAATGPVVVMKTSLGEIRIQLDQDKRR